MSNILFIGDLHLSDRQISTRVDDTTETCLEKLQWILDFAKSQEADIITTGDMFSHTLYSNKTRYRIKQMLGKFKTHGLSFWSISGNHSGDIEDRDINSVIYREFGQFCFDGYVSILGEFFDGFYDYYKESKFGIRFGSILIRGYSAYSELFKGDNGSSDELVQGLVCHHWIMDAFNDSLVVYPDDMKKIFPNLKFIVAGHDHAFHEPYTSRDGVLVVRPGSVMRTDSGKSSDRIPKVVLYTPGFGFVEDKWDYVEIGCARPYNEVFHTEKKQADADSAGALEKFVRQMQSHSGAVMDVSQAIKDQLSLVHVLDRDMIKQDLVQQGYVL